ncbi:MAG TPA: VOC family protein [Buttiauxella sp.]|nr:VOC family protein [Buttiauxella sp.]
MTTLKWDHAVQFVNQPEEAIQIFSENQLNAVAGGCHPGWGTWNALSYFGLTYIEFLAIYDQTELALAQSVFLLSRDAAQLLPENQALHRVALRSDDIDQTHVDLRSKGLQVSPIVDGQRNDPQGHVISWRIFTIDGEFNGLPYPFVLQWGEDDNVRLTRLRTQGLDRPHPAGAVELHSAVFEVQNPQAVRAHWHALFGFNELPEGLAVGHQRFIFREGEANRLVELVFNTQEPALKGQRFRVGNGEYRFLDDIDSSRTAL